jgi:hypothetical protein
MIPAMLRIGDINAGFEKAAMTHGTWPHSRFNVWEKSIAHFTNIKKLEFCLLGLGKREEA